jgi:ABC-2 type transport system permease protein
MNSLLLRYYSKIASNYFKKQTTARTFTVGSFLILVILLMVGVYLFFIEGFNYISDSRYFGEALFLYLYEMFFPVLAFLLAFSGVIFGIFSLFQDKNDQWLMASPNYKTLFKHKVLTILISSSWPIAVIALPFALAVGVFFGLSIFWEIFLFVGILFFSLIIILTSLGLIFLIAGLLLLLSKILKKNILKLSWLTGFVLAFFLVISLFFGAPITKNRPGNIFNAKDLGETLAGTKKIEKQFKILPTHLPAKAVFDLQKRNFQGLITPLFFALGSFAIVLAGLFLANKNFLFLWQRFQEGSFRAEKKSTAAKKRNAFNKTQSLASVLFIKEGLKLLRNKKNLLWLVFTLSLWFLYSGMNYFFIKHSDFKEADQALLPLAISALQFLVAIYFTTALVLRFAFPSFSEEKKSIWIIAGAPVDLGKIFIHRAIFYSLLFVLIGFLFGFLNLFQIESNWFRFLFTLDLFALSIVFVTILGLSLGAIFPNFETDDPQKLSTSLPGLGFIFASLFYGGLASFVFYRFYFAGDWIIFWSFEFLSIILILILCLKSIKKLRKRDFVKIF